jgi:Amidohydrolase.
MIVQGMFDKYPKQKVIFQEGGYWWLPDFMLRMDDFYLGSGGDIALVERKLARARRSCKKCRANMCSTMCASPPSRSPCRRTAAFRLALEMCHAKDLFCFSSDWPHQTLDPANWVVENTDASTTTCRKPC